jgi:hypothetical protein
MAVPSDAEASKFLAALMLFAHSILRPHCCGTRAPRRAQGLICGELQRCLQRFERNEPLVEVGLFDHDMRTSTSGRVKATSIASGKKNDGLRLLTSITTNP